MRLLRSISLPRRQLSDDRSLLEKVFGGYSNIEDMFLQCAQEPHSGRFHELCQIRHLDLPEVEVQSRAAVLKNLETKA